MSASGRATAWGLACGAVPVAAIALLDPRRAGWSGVALALGAGALLSARGRRPAPALLVLLACVAGCWSVAAWLRPEFRADAFSYFVQLRSLAFDADLDLANEWQRLGMPVPPATPRGVPANTHPIGPALFWAPFYLLAHVYALAGGPFVADGFSEPYLRAPALGTLAVWVVGVALLLEVLRRRYGAPIAAVAVASTVLASPVAYYAFVVPAMAHGLVFGLAAAVLWASDRATRRPHVWSWTLAGALVGLVALTRWQAALVGLLLIAPALGNRRAGRLRPAWLVAAGLAGAAALLPQLLVWRAIFGRFLVLPQGGGYVDWSSPHLSQVLFSANHGLFTWTPIAAIGLLGLAAGMRRDPPLHLAGIALFAATAWVNGSVAGWDWEGGDAFGARRFDAVMPLVALGVAALLAGVAPALARRPLLAPSLALAALALWNLGFVRLFRSGLPANDGVSLERLSAAQARSLRHGVEWLFGSLAGARGRARAYDTLSAEYLHTQAYPGGTIRLATADERLLREGWYGPPNLGQQPPFRWAYFPEACLDVPLAGRRRLSLELEARAPGRALPQRLDLRWNGHAVASAPLTQEWQTLRAAVPEDAVQPGENRLCLRFSNAVPADEGARVAAGVAHVTVR